MTIDDIFEYATKTHARLVVLDEPKYSNALVVLKRLGIAHHTDPQLGDLAHFAMFGAVFVRASQQGAEK